MNEWVEWGGENKEGGGEEKGAGDGEMTIEVEE